MYAGVMIATVCCMQVVDHWNAHRIRPTNGSRCPPGVPDELFFLPPHGAVDCLQRPTAALPGEDTDRLVVPSVCDSAEIEAYLAYLCTFHNWSSPTTCDEAVQLYIDLHASFVVPDQLR